MNSLLRSIFTPVAVLASAAVLAWLFIRHEQRQQVTDRVAVKADLLALRIAAVDAAKKAHQVMLETERIAYERAKQEEAIAELADLGHEVRLLRIEIDFKSVLAGIDKRYPPPNPPPVEVPSPEAPAPVVPTPVSPEPDQKPPTAP